MLGMGMLGIAIGLIIFYNYSIMIVPLLDKEHILASFGPKISTNTLLGIPIVIFCFVCLGCLVLFIKLKRQ